MANNKNSNKKGFGIKIMAIVLAALMLSGAVATLISLLLL